MRCIAVGHPHKNYKKVHTNGDLLARVLAIYDHYVVTVGKIRCYPVESSAAPEILNTFSKLLCLIP